MNGDKCNHVNGSCQNGCDAGVSGDKCDKGDIIGFEFVGLLLIIIFYYAVNATFLLPFKNDILP